jgi:hypothetical protein
LASNRFDSDGSIQLESGMSQGPLSPEQIEQFVSTGIVKVEAAFSRETAVHWQEQCCRRLGIDPEDASTWTRDRVHMGGTEEWNARDFAPMAWAAACQLCGGEDRVHEPWIWSDHFIVNLGERSGEPWQPAGPDCPGWHKDGDFFRHFLDSPEQGLLTLVLWTDVVHQGGPTYAAADSVGVIARYLADRPEGVLPNGFPFQELIRECSDFVEATGQAGDVYLIHPYLLHAVSQNKLRRLRIITNPPISLREPMRFSRPDGAYSPVELAVLRGLGAESFDFHAASPREAVVPARLAMQAKLMEEERARLGN